MKKEKIAVMKKSAKKNDVPLTQRLEALAKSGIEVGSIVALKSGGPSMTVDSVEASNGDVRCCFWVGEPTYSAGEVRWELFDARALKVVVAA